MEHYAHIAQQARIDVLSMVYRAQAGHIGSNLSCIDIATVLYENLTEDDRVVWSKGWVAATIYYFNWKYGRGPKEAVEDFPKAPYFGLAETAVPGVEVNGGSVGHGLSIAVGMALARKRSGQGGKIFCIMSDGELNEGSVWEAAMLASHHRLDNLVAVIDRNSIQSMGYTKDICDIDARDAFAGFHWDTTIVNGHDFMELETGIRGSAHGRPTAVIAHTIKGKGVSFMEGSPLYHYKKVDDETYDKAVAELQ
jgi:transketolase